MEVLCGTRRLALSRLAPIASRTRPTTSRAAHDQSGRPRRDDIVVLHGADSGLQQDDKAGSTAPPRDHQAESAAFRSLAAGQIGLGAH
jgi:hypothetical protein